MPLILTEYASEDGQPLAVQSFELGDSPAAFQDNTALISAFHTSAAFFIGDYRYVPARTTEWVAARADFALPISAEGAAGEGGGGEVSSEWFIYFQGDATDPADQPDVGDTIVINDQTYTFGTPDITEDPVTYTYPGPNYLATHVETENPGNQNYLYNVVNAIVYAIFDPASGAAAGVVSDGTVAPTSVEIDIGSYSALNNAIIADPDQSEGPWPPLRIFSEGDFPVDFSGLAAAAMMVASPTEL